MILLLHLNVEMNYLLTLHKDDSSVRLVKQTSYLQKPLFLVVDTYIKKYFTLSVTIAPSFLISKTNILAAKYL